MPEEHAAGGKLSHNCYVEHAVPACLYFLYSSAVAADDDTQQSAMVGMPKADSEAGRYFEQALLANANVGGDCTNRGALLGCLAGAACGEAAIPRHLIEGLAEREALGKEIDAFVAAVCGR